MEIVISAYRPNLTKNKKGLMYFNTFSVGEIGKQYWQQPRQNAATAMMGWILNNYIMGDDNLPFKSQLAHVEVQERYRNLKYKRQNGI